MIVTAESLAGEFHKLRTANTFRKTFSTGYAALDEIIKLSLGYLAVVSGYPSSGKSEWVDAVLVNAIFLHGWKTLYFSPENYPIQEHIAKLAEKILGKWVRHFTKDEEAEVLKLLNLHFAWIDIDKEFPTIEDIFARALERKAGLGLDCLVIDPWNALRHQKGIHQREDEYLAEILTQISYFARRNQLLIIIVAHPKTIAREKGGKLPRCTVADINGGAMWWNKVDYAFMAHREVGKDQIEIEVSKVKQKWMGTQGSRLLDYEKKSGRFRSPHEKEFLLPHEVQPPF